MILSDNFKIKNIPRGDSTKNSKTDEALDKKDEENPLTSKRGGGIWSDESNCLDLFFVRFLGEIPNFLNIEICSLNLKFDKNCSNPSKFNGL